jgi:hypothetical protein
LRERNAAEPATEVEKPLSARKVVHREAPSRSRFAPEGVGALSPGQGPSGPTPWVRYAIEKQPEGLRLRHVSQPYGLNNLLRRPTQGVALG